ncbi:type II toxin-antitoxin system Phd/YefM family antitoxin [Mycolicibacterium phlei]|uniref:type II toxin-antitoxin system Phd/YefM family antitoxin n=1 Tax=Mycolicibacterium phlei TaxID=1771 RepID=UPI0037CBBC97
MKTVTKRDLNQRTAAVLDQVTDDADVVVTERGEPRWRVSRFREQRSQLERLERDGSYTPPTTQPAPWARLPAGRPYPSAEVDDLIDEIKGDR